MLSLNMVPKMPISISVMILFIAQLYEAKYAPTSITSILSAISYFHKVNGEDDPTKAVAVTKLMTGARNLKSSSDLRLPITPAVLKKLIDASYHVFISPYMGTIIRAMMVLAFKAYLRIGEMVPRMKGEYHKCLQVGDITIVEGNIVVHFKQFKHSSKQGAQTLQVKYDLVENTNISVKQYIEQFRKMRGNVQGAFFAFPDGSPLLRREFDEALKQLLTFCGLNSQQFKGHSFRIGAATAAAARGESDAQIRAAGRWVSDAFKSYIRLS